MLFNRPQLSVMIPPSNPPRVHPANDIDRNNADLNLYWQIWLCWVSHGWQLFIGWPMRCGYWSIMALGRYVSKETNLKSIIAVFRCVSTFYAEIRFLNYVIITLWLNFTIFNFPKWFKSQKNSSSEFSGVTNAVILRWYDTFGLSWDPRTFSRAYRTVWSGLG